MLIYLSIWTFEPLNKDMKTIKLNLLLLLTIVSFNVLKVYSQPINNTAENQNIQAFIKIWGLVKYKSEKSTAGKLDADRIFLNMIDQVKKADQTQFNLLMSTFVEENNPSSISIALAESRKKRNNYQYLVKNTDYRWINGRQFFKKLRQQLSALSTQQNLTGKHQYIPSVWYEGNLPNEAPYEDYTFDQEEMNLLALAKTWNAIEYLFPYKYMTDKNWNKVLCEMVPVFRQISDRSGYEKSILMLAVAINDTHASGFMSSENMRMVNVIFNVRYYPPFDYKVLPSVIIIKKFLNDSLAKSSALKTGDEIIAINSIRVKEWIKSRATLIPASNDAAKFRQLSTANNNRGDTFAFSNLDSGTLNVEIRRNGTTMSLKLTMLDRQNRQNTKLIENDIIEKREHEKTISGREAVGEDITMFRAGNFFEKDLPTENNLAQLSTELKSKRAIIFDMRKYPQAPGLFSYYIPMLLGKAPFAFARYYAVNLKDPGTFILREGIENYMYVPKDGTKPFGQLYKGKIVILTDEHTQSMGEWFTMMLSQLNSNTTIIGSQTAGADGDLKYLTLPGNYIFNFTGNGIFYPDGRETQRNGIKPDIYFTTSAKNLSGTEDAQLQRALRYINDGK